MFKLTSVVPYLFHDPIVLWSSLGLSDSAFSTNKIVAESIVTIFQSFIMVCLLIIGLLI